MQNPSVHWFEGMFLRPQHFQAADRYWSEAIHLGQSWDHAYGYGIQAIEIFDAITPAERYKFKVGLVSRHANHIGNLADELLHTIPSAGPI